MASRLFKSRPLTILFNRIFNEIFIEERLTSINYYQSYPWYRIPIGKSNSQELHNWIHWYDHAKWVYLKDLNNGWYDLYTPFHNSTSNGEKIVSWIYNGVDGTQIWALGEI